MDTRINLFLQNTGLKETYPDIKREIVEVIINRSFLDPSYISDEEIQSIIDNIITTDLQITQEASSRSLPGLKIHRGRRDSENVDDSVKTRKSMRVGSNSGEMLTKGGARYNLKRKTVRRNKRTRKQKITKNKRKLTRKQY